MTGIASCPCLIGDLRLDRYPYLYDSRWLTAQCGFEYAHLSVGVSVDLYLTCTGLCGSVSHLCGSLWFCISPVRVSGYVAHLYESLWLCISHAPTYLCGFVAHLYGSLWICISPVMISVVLYLTCTGLYGAVAHLYRVRVSVYLYLTCTGLHRYRRHRFCR